MGPIHANLEQSVTSEDLTVITRRPQHGTICFGSYEYNPKRSRIKPVLNIILGVTKTHACVSYLLINSYMNTCASNEIFTSGLEISLCAPKHFHGPTCVKMGFRSFVNCTLQTFNHACPSNCFIT